MISLSAKQSTRTNYMHCSSERKTTVDNIIGAQILRMLQIFESDPTIGGLIGP